mgnify:CR=1 FL=1
MRPLDIPLPGNRIYDPEEHSLSEILELSYPNSSDIILRSFESKFNGWAIHDFDFPSRETSTWRAAGSPESYIRERADLHGSIFYYLPLSCSYGKAKKDFMETGRESFLEGNFQRETRIYACQVDKSGLTLHTNISLVVALDHETQLFYRIVNTEDSGVIALGSDGSVIRENPYNSIDSLRNLESKGMELLIGKSELEVLECCLEHLNNWGL